jgi:hypothetical protein
MSVGNVPVIEFAELKSEVHHLGIAVGETREQVDRLGGEFGRVASEVHYLSRTIRWAATVLGALIVSGAGAVVYKVIQR